MKPWKKIGIFLLLAVLTCCVVFGPPLISRQSEEKRLRETVYRSYKTGERSKPTSEQVARLYLNREISIDYDVNAVIRDDDASTAAPDDDEKAIRETILDLLETLFEEENTLCDPIREMFTHGGVRYDRSSRLIKIGSQPTALHFVNYSVENEAGQFHMIYEEKTQTVLSMSCDILEAKMEPGSDANLQREVSVLKRYFENRLGLDSGEYFFTADALPCRDGASGASNSSVFNLILGCAILPSERKEG